MRTIQIEQPEQTDPASYRKYEYHPFGIKSETWTIFYFKGRTERNKLRLYESYGRTAEEAFKALVLAVNFSAYFIFGKLEFQETRKNTITPISKSTYNELRKKKKKK